MFRLTLLIVQSEKNARCQNAKLLWNILAWQFSIYLQAVPASELDIWFKLVGFHSTSNEQALSGFFSEKQISIYVSSNMSLVVCFYLLPCFTNPRKENFVSVLVDIQSLSDRSSTVLIFFEVFRLHRLHFGVEGIASLFSSESSTKISLYCNIQYIIFVSEIRSGWFHFLYASRS